MSERMGLSIFSFNSIKSIKNLSILRLGKIIVCVSALALMFPFSYLILVTYVKDENSRTSALKSITDQTKVLIVGSSHVATNIKPALISISAMNLSIPNANYTDVLKMMLKVWDKAKNIEILVIEFSSPMLLRGSGGTIRQMAQFDFGFSDANLWNEFMQDPIDSFRNCIFYIYNYRLVPRHMFDRTLQPTRKTRYENPGHETYQANLDKNRSKSSAIKRYQAVFETTTRDSIYKNTLALKKAILMARERHINIIFLKMPEHEQLDFIRPTVWKDDPLIPILADLPLIDKTSWHRSNDLFFGDFDHLNDRGAAHFSIEIDKLLMSLNMQNNLQAPSQISYRSGHFLQRPGSEYSTHWQ